ncbi:protein FAM117B-like [Rhopilema esculentum]|uniref:protein FAM117B-like n=1 Tax=Rhopilema esculentum TaxID=499914 RepID=UPI0031E45636|eukprot:gene14449-5508_t
MASQRPRRNNSPASGKLKPQPLKATAPISSLVRNNPSPTRRRQSSPVPSPGLVETTKSRIRRSPDVFSSEHRTLVSPLGDKPRPVRLGIARTNSLETLSSSYMNGQWPKDGASAFVQSTCNKGTQTLPGPDDVTEENQRSNHKRSNSIGSDTKEKFKQFLQRTKQSQPIHGKQSPLQGDHSAVGPQTSFSTGIIHSRAIPIPSNPKTTNLHTRRSVEGLNPEIETLVQELGLNYNEKTEKTPEGRKAPFAGYFPRNVDSHTQTSNGLIDPSELYINIPAANTSGPNSRSQSTSPSWPIAPGGIPESRPSSRSSSTGATMQDNQSPESNSSSSKFSSSPNFLFTRGPPDGAEKVPSHVESTELKEDYVFNDLATRGPDKTKGKILFSQNSPFYPLPLVPRMAVNMSPGSQVSTSAST